LNDTTAAIVTFEPLGLKSEGTVRLASVDAGDAPLIDPKYFSHPDDMPLYVEGYKAAMEMLDLKEIKSIAPGDRSNPPLDVDTDEEIENFIRANFGGTDFHPLGSCRMGMEPENGDVVDNHARVYGVANLRILDSSIFPVSTRGNPTSPSMLVGLRGAEIIMNENY
jgi:choline dehydrogenase